MTFWSENHQVLFASAEYLAGQWLRDDVFRAGLPLREEGPNGTRPGDKTGELRMRSAKARLLRWLADRMRLGFSEWNALPYYEEDIEPLLNLIDFCLDEEIRSRAEIVLDMLLFDVARFAHNGNFAPTSGRCYANQKMCGYEPGIGDLVEILFGTRRGVIVWGGATSAGAFASSRRYVVPDVLIRIGQDRPDAAYRPLPRLPALRRGHSLRRRVRNPRRRYVLVESQQLRYQGSGAVNQADCQRAPPR